MPPEGRLLPVHDTSLYVVERGAPDALPVLCLHGGPGMDHTQWGCWLDPLTEDGRYRLVLIDQRAQGRSDRSAPPETWTLQTMASDVSGVAAALGADDYAVLGHSYGSFVALQHAVDAHGAARATVVSNGVPSSRYLDAVADNLAAFEPVELREQVSAAWARETSVVTEEGYRSLLVDQLPFHFADPRDPRIQDYVAAQADARYAPDMLRRFSVEGYGGIDVEAQLPSVIQPMLILTGAADRVCVPEASRAMAEALPNSRLVVFENSGHTPFVEETEAYVRAVRDFLDGTHSSP